jgi:23S rRNA (adenine2503-C2)-methyltransferase
VTRDLKKLSLEELETYLEGLGEPLWRAGDIRRWLYMRGATDLEEMTTLPKNLREKMAEDFTLYTPAIANYLKAADGTEKLALRLVDGALVETVLIPLEGKLTLCISSQSGCTLKCAFCQTGRLGKGRNLAAAEILDQWLAAGRSLSKLSCYFGNSGISNDIGLR